MAPKRERPQRGSLAREVRLGPMADERFALGWELRASSPDQALLAVSSGSTQAELLCRREPGALSGCFRASRPRAALPLSMQSGRASSARYLVPFR